MHEWLKDCKGRYSSGQVTEFCRRPLAQTLAMQFVTYREVGHVDPQ